MVREERRRLRRRRRARLRAAELGCSRGGLTTKTHLAAERRCRPLSFVLTPGQAADSPRFATLPELAAATGQAPTALRRCVANSGSACARSIDVSPISWQRSELAPGCKQVSPLHSVAGSGLCSRDRAHARCAGRSEIPVISELC